jgi:hypothetical protein
MPRAQILDLRWSALFNDYRRSGLTQAEFCDRRGISIHAFRKRLYRARLPKSGPKAQCSSSSHTSPFLPVTILPDPAPAIATTSQSLELVLANGRRIAVPPGFDPQTLRRLLAVVEAGRCSD